MLLQNYLLVAVGGAIGSMLRYSFYLLVKNSHFPLATFIVNLLGSLIIGLVLGISIKHAAFNNNWRLFLATGICGGFTTFSAFSYESFSLLKSGHYSYFVLYVAGTFVFGIF